MIKREEKKFINAKEVADSLDISVSSSYRIIKKLNCELEEMGKITLAGKVSRRYFEEKIYM
ncbi:helix-turn-helix domain-containing protein [Fusobacteria bacterium ZRK30]|nr:helix-turn-helix domain-containing protein [Fusobacteria bacterium ZRK30]